jgi:hypothetical protein
VKSLYEIWVKIDVSLPWFELKGEYSTTEEAKIAAKEYVKGIKIRILSIPEKRKSVTAFAPLKATR